MRTCIAWIVGLAAVSLGAPGARGDMVELVGGRAVHGKILHGQTSEEGLAVELFDTGGVIVVKWEHILPARAKELRESTGVEVAEGEEILVVGHRVRLITGEVVEGRAVNPDAKDQPLQLKTRTGTQVIERARIAAVTETQLPGLFVYDAEELYQIELAKNAPDTAARHLELAHVCMQIGALDRAKDHLAAAAADPAFASGPGGKPIPAMQKQLDGLIKSKGAQDMVANIKGAMRSDRWNDAQKTLDELDKKYQDEQVRRLIHFDLVASQVVRGRTTYFQRKCQSSVYAVMVKLIEEKARVKKPLRPDPDQPRGVAVAGSLASAKQWMSKDLPKAIWDRVQADLGISADELDAFWKTRSSKKLQSANYGTGSFIVIKKAQGPKGGDANRPKPPGARRDGGAGAGGPPRAPAKEDKARTDEEWYEERSTTDRKNWLIAYFVESSGIFEISRTDESEICDSCAGKGVLIATTTDGGQSSTVCAKCNQSGKFRKVFYR